MAASDAQIAELRRMCALDESDETYTDSVLSAYIEAHPTIDPRGEEPYYYDTSTTPPTRKANPAWIPTYDLHAAAARVWQEKAAAYATRYDVNADGSALQRSQLMKQAMAQMRHHLSRRAGVSSKWHRWPKENYPTYPNSVANAPEPED